MCSCEGRKTLNLLQRPDQQSGAHQLATPSAQDEITRSVAAAIEPHLLAAEGLRPLSRSSDNIEAWELVARAQTHFWRMTRADDEMATTPLERAIATYADYAPARGLLAFCLLFAVHMGWIERDRAVVPIASTPLGPLPLAIAITGGTSLAVIGP